MSMRIQLQANSFSGSPYKLLTDFITHFQILNYFSRNGIKKNLHLNVNTRIKQTKRTRYRILIKDLRQLMGKSPDFN